jgi:hypothetical protein
MARSTYIYVLWYEDDFVAAFTVKHELVTWLKSVQRQPESIEEYRVERVRDGVPTIPASTDMGTAEHFLADHG